MVDTIKPITTYSGEDFTPLRPNINQIHLEDIAHALSLMCRANGHFERFFSVAQHCINCAAEAGARGYSEKIQLACLLHDASEAYIADITRPVKQYLTTYLEIEKNLQDCIYQKFLNAPLTDEEHGVVTQIDDDMLVCEFDALMKKKVFEHTPQLTGKPNFKTASFFEVEAEFIRIFNTLTKADTQSLLPEMEFLSVGIDGCKGKWLAVTLSNKDFDVELFDNISDVCSNYQAANSIIIDMPIGLAESKADVRPDSELRKHLKGKSSCVFNTPCRQAVYAKNYTQAIAENQKILDLSISPFSNAIIPKIREIDLFLQTHPQWKNRLLESHPEYCFMLLNGGQPILQNKKTSEGSAARIRVLQSVYPRTRELIEFFKTKYPRLSSKLDDVLDALALAVIGGIALKSGVCVLPGEPMLDAKGIKMQIIGAEL